MNDNTVQGYTNIFDVIGNLDFNFGPVISNINASLEGEWVIYLKLILLAIGILILVALVIISFKVVDVIKEIHQLYNPAYAKESRKTELKIDRKGMMKSTWESVARHMAGNNPSDWKLSILEADSILDELLKEINLPGETLGERLKMATERDIKNLQYAWEAHKVRNRIAHEGLKAVISREEAVRVLGMYERVFREFDYI